MKRGNRLYVFKSHKEQPDDEITHDFVMDHCVIHGSVNKVVDAILKMREETGDFGELVYAGMDWVDPALAKRSMQLMAEQVMPRVNAAIGKAARPRRSEFQLPLKAEGADISRRAPCARRCRRACQSAARRGEGLQRKASVALVGRLGVAADVEDAAGEPDQPQHRRAPVVDIERETTRAAAERSASIPACSAARGTRARNRDVRSSPAPHAEFRPRLGDRRPV